MKTKPSMFFVIGAVVAALLIAGSGVLVFTGFAGFGKTDRQYAAKRKALSAFYKLEPFPSNENVTRERENVEDLKAWYSNLMTRVSEGQLELEERSPSTFMALLGQKKRKLIAAAEDKVELPFNFAFGFDRYFAAGAQLPSPTHVPRLTQQLVIIESLCEALYAEEVLRIRAVNRQPLESLADRRGARRGGGAEPGEIPEDGLYARLNFGLEFEATENALIGVLNRLAAHELFVVVTRLDMAKTRPDVTHAEDMGRGERAATAGVAAEPVATDDVLSRLQRIVCGRPVESPMSISLGLDVYRFRGLDE